MLTTILIGIVTSVYTELVKYVDKKLVGTFFDGLGAFLFTLFIATIAALVKVLVIDQYPGAEGLLHQLWTTLAQVWFVAQLYFHAIAKTFNLRVSPSSSTSPIL